jgi:cell division septal protein FtsQ
MNLPKDSKIRFQRRAFKQQLREARVYKRDPLKNQRTASSNILKILGGGSPLAKLAIGFTLILAIYLVYVPNFLYVKNIEIAGLDSRNAQDVKFLLAQYFASQKFFPKNNILLLPKKDLTSYLLSGDKDLLKVSLNRKFPQTLKISAELRKNQYLITVQQGQFVVSNDGLVTLAENSSSTSGSALTLIKIRDDIALQVNLPYPNQQQLEAVAFLNSRLPEKINDSINYFELQNFKQTDIIAVTEGGYKIFLDSNTDLSDTLNKLHLLLISIAPQDVKRLFYIDMRVKNRGYVCLKGTPCAVSQPIVNTSTSTASSTLEKLP